MQFVSRFVNKLNNKVKILFLSLVLLSLIFFLSYQVSNPSIKYKTENKASDTNQVIDNRDHPSPFGLMGMPSVHEFGKSTSYLLGESGARWVRNGFAWNIVQLYNKDLTNNTFNWDRPGEPSYDQKVKKLLPDIKILGVLIGNVKWDKNKPNNKTQSSLTPPDLNQKIYLPQLGKEVSYWENYVYHTVSRYGARSNGLGESYGQNRIKYWEVWNEEDSNFWTDDQGNPKPNGHEYAMLLKATYDIIKQADPTAIVVLGGLSDWRSNSVNNPKIINTETIKFLYNLYHTDVNNDGVEEKFDNFDILGDHPYRAIYQGNTTSVFIKEYTDDLIRVFDAIQKGKKLESNNPNELIANHQLDYNHLSFHKPIWFTEIGIGSWPNCFNTTAWNNLNNDSKKNILDSNALVLQESISQALNHRSGLVKKVFWYILTVPSRLELDSNNPNYDTSCYVMANCVDGKSNRDQLFCDRWEKEPIFNKYKELAWQQFNKPNENNINAGIDLLANINNQVKNNSNIFLDIDVPQSERIELYGKFQASKSDISVKNLSQTKTFINTKDPDNNNSYLVLFDNIVHFNNNKGEFIADLTPYRGLKLPLSLSLPASDVVNNGIKLIELKIRYNQKSTLTVTKAPAMCMQPLAVSQSGPTGCISENKPTLIIKDNGIDCYPHDAAIILWKDNNENGVVEKQGPDQLINGSAVWSNQSITEKDKTFSFTPSSNLIDGKYLWRGFVKNSDKITLSMANNFNSFTICNREGYTCNNDNCVLLQTTTPIPTMAPPQFLGWQNVVNDKKYSIENGIIKVKYSFSVNYQNTLVKAQTICLIHEQGRPETDWQAMTNEGFPSNPIVGIDQGERICRAINNNAVSGKTFIIVPAMSAYYGSSSKTGFTGRTITEGAPTLMPQETRIECSSCRLVITIP